ncbi:hypothetical protein TSUD_66280 [Trifolium subterraneum]|uniref:Uncharacterized protein n=1 Tax=Trifolium subterraneum TaxID=3900 RepID=A0A2Z6NRC9_TRISU|nr:hypothetical protein TSUD_66280 [Trifolium subterraneum]
MISIGIRPRLIPPLQEDYFGNAMIDCVVTIKVSDLLGDGGLGKGALEMNKMIALHSDEKLKYHYDNWLTTPSFVNIDEANSKLLVISGSPWFNVYGVEEGSMDLEVCLSHENLESIENNPEFMDYVSS